MLLLASVAAASGCGHLRAPGMQAPAAPGLAVAHVEMHAELEALFRRTEGWIGADGAQSVDLGGGRTLWLFSDTWVGSVREGRRVDATIVNNSAAIQERRGDDVEVRFVIKRDGDGAPQALIRPADGRGWFWLQAAVLVGGKLFLFMPQVERSDDPGVFGFRVVAVWLGVVSDPQRDPAEWTVEQHQLPHALFTPAREIAFGCSVLRHGEHLYVYGTDEDVLPGARDRHLVLARVRAEALLDFAAWEFLREGRWQSDFRACTRLVPEMGSECSVVRLPGSGRLALVYTQGGLSERVLGRGAMQPWGPWSEPVELFRCPEMGWDERIFCYSGKAHASQAGAGELVVSYAANSFDFAHVAADARLYWPRFVRVRLEPLD